MNNGQYKAEQSTFWLEAHPANHSASQDSGKDSKTPEVILCLRTLGSLNVSNLDGLSGKCERLQGFNDDHTMIAWRNKPADQCPDGPRYKALGNSMAVPCMAWIGKRIARVENERQGVV
jgi:hypothetical protein